MEYDDTIKNVDGACLPIVDEWAKRGDGNSNVFVNMQPTVGRPFKKGRQMLNGLLHHLKEQRFTAKVRRQKQKIHDLAAQESDRLYRTIFNSVSHELRIPIASVMAASDALKHEAYPDYVREEFYSQIHTAGLRLNHLIENLLNTSRIESGKITPNIDWNDINDLFNCVTNELEEQLRPFDVEVTVSESMPLVQFDFGLMEQVVQNLLHNSCKYADEGTKIELKASYADGNLIIEQTDGGPGFPEDMLTHVFDKFNRLGTHVTGGLGLGLSIVQGFVKAHGGKIAVENRKEGGARFTIAIPTQIPDMQHLML
jgi:two-component system sensor histidine kinase KdpD